MCCFCCESDTGSSRACWICYTSYLKCMFSYENDMLIISYSRLTLLSGATVLGFHPFFSHPGHLWAIALCSSASYSILRIFILHVHYSQLSYKTHSYQWHFSSWYPTIHQVYYYNSLTASSAMMQFWRLDHTWNICLCHCLRMNHVSSLPDISGN